MTLPTMPALCRKTSFDAALHDSYAIRMVQSIDEVEEEWALVSDSHDIFYSAAFLRCIEKATPSGITPYYCLVTNHEKPIGIIYLQSKSVRLEENLRADHKREGKFRFSPLLWFKKWVIRQIHFHTVICGNLMLTGRYGFYFPGNLGKDEQFRLVAEATRQLQHYLSKTGVKPGLVLVKDFFSDEAPLEEDKAFGFTRFTVQPKMMLPLSPMWSTMEDYVLDLKSKYRVRYKKALQKGAEMEKKELSSEEIAHHRKEIMKLYRCVANQAAFNAFYLHDHYFEELKSALGTALTFKTYWKNGKLIAFFTSITNYDVLDAHFLGYDPDENQDCQIYLNMLFDLIQEGIDKKMRLVDMSRTAIEIKSTVGAIPKDMYLYLKHSHPLINRATNSILSFVKPSDEFIIRSPFKDSPDSNSL